VADDEIAATARAQRPARRKAFAQAGEEDNQIASKNGIAFRKSLQHAQASGQFMVQDNVGGQKKIP
jgi:hypothetical protein